MEPITCALILGAKALVTGLAHSAAAHTAIVHTAAVASHGVTTTKGAYLVSHSAPAVHQLASSTITATQTQGVVPALKGAATVLAGVGTSAGIAAGISEAAEGVRNRDTPKAVKGAAETGLEIADLPDITW
ncbi:MAG TPA: hypothetical protein VKU39_13320 [Streptosporangiaceae bacterium]|nr:hypothetical protein [Streptosporangiaceae bacterium]